MVTSGTSLLLVAAKSGKIRDAFILVLSRFGSDLFQAIFAMKGTGNGIKIQRRVQT